MNPPDRRDIWGMETYTTFNYTYKGRKHIICVSNIDVEKDVLIF